MLGWNEFFLCGMKKTPVLRFARGRDRINLKKRSEKEFDRPELHRILSKPCLYWESEGVQQYQALRDGPTCWPEWPRKIGWLVNEDLYD